MAGTPDPNDTPQVEQVSSLGVLAARLMWFLIGPLLLAAMTFAIIDRGSGWLTGWDAAFAVVVALMLVGRWVEQRSGTATTATGEPATPRHLRRYRLVLLPAAAGLWVLANVLGNHVLS